MSEKKNLTNSLQCGSCTFRERDKIFEKKCSELGKLPSGRSCTSHTADIFSLLRNDSDRDSMEVLANLISNYSPTELHVLASLMIREKQTRKLGYHFYQKVWVRIQGRATDNYFSNFAVGHILDATKESVRIIGFHKKSSVCVYAVNERDSQTFYTIDRFAPIRDTMMVGKRFTDPAGAVYSPNRRHIANIADKDVAPIIDGPRSKVKRLVKDDLVSLVGRIASGIGRKKRFDDVTTRSRRIGDDEEYRIVG